MMKKKNPKLELESSRKVFFQLGLFIVGSATLMAFSYKSPVYLTENKVFEQREIDIPIMLVEKDIEPIIEIPEVEKLVDKSEPTTPIFSIDLLNHIDLTKNRDKNQKLAVTSSQLQDVTSGNFSLDLGEAPDVVLVEFPDVDAQFQGSWLSYLQNTVKYPEESVYFKEFGTAYMVFVVEVDGSVTDVQVRNKSLSKNLQEEAIRVIEASPKWKPGMKNGEYVRSTKNVKINFILQ